MSEFSANDINDAKRRVEEMRQRARGMVDTPAAPSAEERVDSSSVQQSRGIGSILSSFGVDSLGSDSSLILALILILSKEGADNMLIMALLYILL